MMRRILPLLLLFLFGLLWPAKALAVDCSVEQISRFNIIINPITFGRDETVNLQIFNVPESFRGQTFRFSFDAKDQTGPFRDSYYLFDVTIDSQGNFTRSFVVEDLAPSLPEGSYVFSLSQDYRSSEGQPFQVQVCNEPFTSEFALVVQGGATCLPLGASCDPNNRSATYCEQSAFCDAEQTPPTVRLPGLTNAILGGADCAYRATNGQECAAVDSTLPVACTDEQQLRLGTDPNLPVQPSRMCCSSQIQCDLALGAAEEELSEPQLEAFRFCQQVPSGQQGACQSCVGGSGDEVSGKIYTAVGCLSTSGSGLAGDLIRLMLGVGGALALLSILASGFIYSTSQGDAGKLKEAKELATGAVSGLLFMIFSVIILNFIGVQVLRIPGLS